MKTDTDKTGGFDWIAAAPVALSVAGIVLYGVVTIADERFYEALGISSADVGLNYANTLVRANGLVLISVLYLLYLGPYFLLFQFAWSRAFRSNVPQEHMTEEDHRRAATRRKSLRLQMLIVSVTAIVLSLAVALPLLYHVAANRADLVSQGHAVGPVKIWGLTILPISADPARAQWITPEPEDSPVLPQHLLFLGQAGSLTPLYDPSRKQIMWLPSALISVQVNH